MVNIDIILNDSSYSLKLPSNLYEIKLKDKLKFDKLFVKFLSEFESNQVPIQYKQTVDLLSILFEEDISFLYSVGIIDDLDDTVAGRLLNYFLQMFDEFENELKEDSNSSFVYKNITFSIPPVHKEIFTGKVIWPKVNMAQVIESTSISNILSDALTKITDEKEKDEIVFTEMLSIISCVTTSTAMSKFPYAGDIDSWVNERNTFFNDISSGDASDVLFFLANT